MTEETIFAEALEKSTPIDRTAYLDKACAGDTVLRQRIETLLKSHEAEGDFLRKPAIQWAVEEIAGQACAGDTQGELPAGDGGVEALEFLAPSDKPGSLGRLGHYEVLEVIGRGGMGIVLRAVDGKLQRVVAIKVMAAQLATNAIARKRFNREAQAAAAVTHDHIVTIHAVEDANGLPYLVMQYVSGMSLQERLDRNGPLELREIVRIGMQTAAGLAAAHAHGLIHRDIKPANILLENGVERVKITDFGLARAVADASLTQSGVVAGTPQYMSPEQARGEAIDQRTDLFSLGSVLYAMCTGRPPFRANSGMAVLKRVCDDTPSAIRETNPEIPDWLVAIVTKLHAKNPADRFQSATEVADLLKDHLAHLQHPSIVGPVAGKLTSSSGSGPRGEGVVCQPSPRRRRWALAAAAVLLSLVAGLGFTEATGVTKLRATVIRIFTADGTLVVEVDDPDVKVTVEGDGGLVITGAGPQEVRLRPGSYKVRADKDGKRILLEREVVSIAKNGREVVHVKLEAPPLAEPAGPVLLMHFDEADFYKKDGKTYVRDRSGNANDGLCDNVAFTPDGKAGGGLLCQGGQLQLAKSLINRQPNYTITAWCRCEKPGPADADQHLYVTARPEKLKECVFHAYFPPERNCWVSAWNADLPERWIGVNTGGSTVPAGWFFVAIALTDGETGKGKLRIVIDDRIHARTSQMVATDGQPPPVDVVGFNMNGVIDELAVFQRALSDEEIQVIRQRGSDKAPPP